MVRTTPGWQFLIDHWAELYRLCDSDDDCFAYAALDRVPRLVDSTYNPALGDLKQYVFNSVKRYRYKWVMRRQEASLDEIEISCLQSVELEVVDLLDGLCPKDRELIELRFLHGLTYRELESRLGRSHMYWQKQVERILRKLRA